MEEGRDRMIEEGLMVAGRKRWKRRDRDKKGWRDRGSIVKTKGLPLTVIILQYNRKKREKPKK